MKHIGLIGGLLLVIFSFLFFARNQVMYNGMLLSGLVLSVVCFVAIVFGRDTKKNKVKWIAIVLLAVGVQVISEPFLIDTSYRIYLTQHRHSLTIVNNILERYGGIFVLGDSVRSVLDTLPKTEQDQLIIEKRKLGVWVIERNDKGIYYGLWGFLDVRLGMTYWTSTTMPGDNYRRIKGAWVR